VPEGKTTEETMEMSAETNACNHEIDQSDHSRGPLLTERNISRVHMSYNHVIILTIWQEPSKPLESLQEERLPESNSPPRPLESLLPLLEESRSLTDIVLELSLSEKSESIKRALNC
jgi:hypothetical protein